MKALYGTVISLLFAVGCGTTGQSTLALKEKVVGKYEFKGKEVTYGMVLVDDLTVKNTKNGAPMEGERSGGKWRIVGKEVWVEYPQRVSRTNVNSAITICRINADGSLTRIAEINNNIKSWMGGRREGTKRTDFIGEAQQEQRTYTKITEK
jgi:hypothetical protein